MILTILQGPSSQLSSYSTTATDYSSSYRSTYSPVKSEYHYPRYSNTLQSPVDARRDVPRTQYLASNSHSSTPSSDRSASAMEARVEQRSTAAGSAPSSNWTWSEPHQDYYLVTYDAQGTFWQLAI
jgi:hypothetical protein